MSRKVNGYEAEYATCQNAHNYFDEFAIRNQVESMILNERDKFMKK